MSQTHSAVEVYNLLATCCQDAYDFDVARFQEEFCWRIWLWLYTEDYESLLFLEWQLQDCPLQDSLDIEDALSRTEINETYRSLLLWVSDAFLYLTRIEEVLGDDALFDAFMNTAGLHARDLSHDKSTAAIHEFMQTENLSDEIKADVDAILHDKREASCKFFCICICNNLDGLDSLSRQSLVCGDQRIDQRRRHL